MNLGGFAGGLAQGYQSQQRLNLQEKDQEQSAQFRDRQIKMQEADAAEKAADRQRQDEQRKGASALFQKYYGEQEVPEGETTVDDGQGGAKKVPLMVKKVFQPGQDTKRDSDYYMDHLMLAAKTSGVSMEDMQRTAQMVEQGRRTDAGKALDKVISGDTSEMATFLKHIKKNPEGAKLDYRPAEGVQQIVLADGEKVDLKRAAMATATAAYVASMRQAEQDAQGTQKNLAAVKASAASTALHEGEAKLLPAKGNLINAQVGAAAASANRSNAAAARDKAVAGQVNDAKVSKQLVDQVKLVLANDPSSMDPKAKDSNMAAYLQGRAVSVMSEGKHRDAAKAVAVARKEWTDVSQQADQWLAGMDNKTLKAKFPGITRDQLRQRAIAKALEGNSMAGAPPAARQVQQDEED